MLSTNRSTQTRPLRSRPVSRIVEPERPDAWTPEEVELLLWPDTPNHLPLSHREEGWPELLGSC